MKHKLFSPPRASQFGFAVTLLVITILLGIASVVYGLAAASRPELKRDQKTTDALALAKATLIAHAVSQPVYAGNSPPNRIGDLPCPDANDDGSADACGNAAGTTGQALRLGRLPWRTLGLPDLRDGDGERLWYAVSNNFKNNTRTNCNTPGTAGCLNSDTRGTISIRNSDGVLVFDASNIDPTSSGVVAIVFSPGAVLRRQDGVVQDRSCTGGAGCNAAGECLATTTPKCNAINYLDIANSEDNANFLDGSAANGFIQGIVRDASGNVIVNDRLLFISYQEVMVPIEKRVAAEILKCLADYAEGNNSRYPWAAPVSDVSGTLDDMTDTLFGRIPDRPLLQTQLGVVPTTTPVVGPALQVACAPSNSLCMSPKWVAPCQLPTDPTVPSWWNNWKLHVFYAVADAYKPLISYTQPTPSTVSLGGIPTPTGCPNCVTVDPPSATADKRVVVIVAGRRLPAIAGGQPRASTADKQDAANYLEGGNDAYPTYTRLPGSATFNDFVTYK